MCYLLHNPHEAVTTYVADFCGLYIKSLAVCIDDENAL